MREMVYSALEQAATWFAMTFEEFVVAFGAVIVTIYLFVLQSAAEEASDLPSLPLHVIAELAESDEPLVIALREIIVGMELEHVQLMSKINLSKIRSRLREQFWESTVYKSLGVNDIQRLMIGILTNADAALENNEAKKSQETKRVKESQADERVSQGRGKIRQKRWATEWLGKEADELTSKEAKERAKKAAEAQSGVTALEHTDELVQSLLDSGNESLAQSGEEEPELGGGGARGRRD
jgi:hypothetical protein